MWNAALQEITYFYYDTGIYFYYKFMVNGISFIIIKPEYILNWYQTMIFCMCIL